MEKYPHKVYVRRVTEGGKDQYGLDTEGTAEFVYYCDCYEQRLGKAMVFEHENGTSFSCMSKVFIPQGIDLIEKGVTVQIRESDEATIRTQGVVNGPVNDYKHSRFWI